ncbi:uncharacterized LabA/DUF88 family protein [Mumia flava]|uniref:Uncharacterized LabA/DUF88 family protein n=1 Tax=Mumia flava TaxID=1348852 RepID=A0A0B2BLN0_9ACTN|nr:NYN domain-containing protein [Mumia flava]PJJ56257.1 uncharacterized LabA/DUF88 family protein [Mumia flava]
MAEPGDTRVAVYIDFDNIVISRYDQVNGRNQFQRDRQKVSVPAGTDPDPEVTEKLERAGVDIGAIIDYASSYGTLVLTRAYADWSAPINADYRGQLVGRAVDLVQLFPAAAYGKNGADIRLAVDAVEDMFRLPDLTHVVIVAGDSDYIALAQRCKRLGRYVVGVGVAGSTSKSLAAACDEMITYDALPGIEPPPAAEAAPKKSTRKRTTKKATHDEAETAEPAAPEEAAAPARGRSGAKKRTSSAQAPVFTEPGSDEQEPEPEDLQAVATRLLARALRLGHEKDDADWLHSSVVKSQMKRMDPSFNEKALGYKSFSDFVKSRDDLAELDESSTARLVRLLARS